MKNFVSSDSSKHNWITVVNPTNQRKLLQACDDCGVVKSENSIIRRCRAIKGQAMISQLMYVNLQKSR